MIRSPECVVPPYPKYAGQRASCACHKTMPVVAIVSPSPTKGDTNPPNPNPIAPNNAEAVPACSRSHSIAKAVVEVKEKPIMKSRAISNPSYIQKLQFRFMAIHTIAERISIPMLLANVLFFRLAESDG